MKGGAPAGLGVPQKKALSIRPLVPLVPRLFRLGTPVFSRLPPRFSDSGKAGACPDVTSAFLRRLTFGGVRLESLTYGTGCKPKTTFSKFKMNLENQWGRNPTKSNYPADPLATLVIWSIVDLIVFRDRVRDLVRWDADRGLYGFALGCFGIGKRRLGTGCLNATTGNLRCPLRGTQTLVVLLSLAVAQRLGTFLAKPTRTNAEMSAR